MQNFVPLIARILLSIVFIRSGISKIMDPAGTQQFMASAGIPLTGLFLVSAIGFELVGAISVLLGYKTRWGAIALIIFLIPATLIFHTNFANSMQAIQFLKNLAIIGGLLMVVAYGPGSISLDARTPSSRSFSRDYPRTRMR